MFDINELCFRLLRKYHVISLLRLCCVVKIGQRINKVYLSVSKVNNSFNKKFY